jgi:membrane peptidoglycan carboxypeptidase
MYRGDTSREHRERTTRRRTGQQRAAGRRRGRNEQVSEQVSAYRGGVSGAARASSAPLSGTTTSRRSLSLSVARHRKQSAPGEAHERRRLPWKKAVLVGGAGGFLSLVALFGIGYAATDIPPANAESTAGATRILFADGSEMGRVGGQNRIPVRLDQVPQDVQEAILAAEDRGFYTEPGISPKGIARALFTNVRGGGDIQQGGSTITQQYAKNAFLTSERTYARKVKEVFLALKMTRERSKASILEDYLNTIYFGRGASGIEVASQTYFGKPVSELTAAEGAVLAATIRSPGNYDPEKSPERARDRWNYVVNGMIEKGWLPPDASLAYPAVQPIGAANKNNDMSGPKGHVITKVLAELETKGIEEGQLAGGGLVVTTTLRRPAQDAAVAAVQERVGDGKDDKGLQGALVSIEPGTGRIVAYYGGATGTGFDHASQGNGNQPGSSFKPYVLAAALEKGIGLGTRLDGSSGKKFPGVPDGVDNFGDRDYGRVDLVEATQKSVNTAYFELGLEVGPNNVAELAHRAGIPQTTRLENEAGNTEAGIALGIYDIHVIDQATGYATFAAQGLAAQPYMVERVTLGDDEVYVAEPRTERAFDEDVAADATYAMQQVVQRGTGTKAKLAGGRPAAGKTGTSQENRDAWFAGFTPQLATAVWIGNGDNTPIKIEGISEVTGGGVSSAVWKAYMDAALEGEPEKGFPPRANIGRSKTIDEQEKQATTSPKPRPSRTPKATKAATTAPSKSAPAEPQESAETEAEAEASPEASAKPSPKPSAKPSPKPSPSSSPGPPTAVPTPPSPSPSAQADSTGD